MSSAGVVIHPGAVIEELGALPDRMLGLLAPITLDQHLTMALRARWRDDGEVLDELFRDGGPIGSFGTRVRVAFATGLYSEDMYRDLLRVNKIRNLFAHKLDAVSFAHQQAHDLAIAMTLPSRFPAARFASASPQEESAADRWHRAQSTSCVVEPGTARGRFLRTAELLDAFLVWRLACGGPAPEPTAISVSP